MVIAMQDGQRPSVHSRYGSAMIYLMWITLIALLAWLIQGWLNKRYNPNSDPEVRQHENGQQELVLQRNPYGHYVSSGSVNGYNSVFILDTGATDVVIPHSVADRFGLEQGYPLQVRTANGIVTVYTTSLQHVTLGHIEQHNVRANINPHMDGNEILLGMSFLKHLRITQVNDQLILSQP